MGISDAPKYDIIWTENENLIVHFFPETLTFKECSMCVQNGLNQEGPFLALLGTKKDETFIPYLTKAFNI